MEAAPPSRGLPETATAIAAAVAAGELSAREVVARSLARIRERDEGVRACVEVLADEALAAAGEIDADRAARGERPLLGVPIAVKEIIEVRGARNTWGCRALRDRRAERDDPYVRLLRDAGAIVVATTNVPELSCWGHTANPVYGETANPADLGRTSGGSSGGSAAAVALGLVPIAIGSDAGGSIRIPASYCGAAGFKPSFAATPADRVAYANRLNVVGPLAASVADAALCVRVLSRGLVGGDRRDLGGVRIAASEDYGFAPLEPRVRETFRAALATLREEGWPIEPARPPAASPLEFMVPMLECEVYEGFAELLESGAHGLSPQTVAVAEIGARTTGREFFRCLARRAEFEAEWEQFLAAHDLVLAPTTQLTAFELGRSGPEQIDGTPVDPAADGSWYPTSFIANVLGAPALSIPCGRDERGLPVGLQLMGRPGEDDLVLATGAAIEASLGFSQSL